MIQSAFGLEEVFLFLEQVAFPRGHVGEFLLRCIEHLPKKKNLSVSKAAVKQQ